MSRNKVKGSYKSSEDKYTVMDEAVFLSQQIPASYKAVNMDLYHPRQSTWKIRPETDKEKEVKKRDTSKVNSPSPFTYKSGDSYFKTVAKKSMICTISKSLTRKFTEEYSRSKKFVPGIGHYDITKADKIISKPRGYK